MTKFKIPNSMISKKGHSRLRFEYCNLEFIWKLVLVIYKKLDVFSYV